jgi:hypothetical protein
MFYRLAEMSHRKEFLVANFAYGSRDWIGDLLKNQESEKRYLEFIRVRDSLAYVVKNEISFFDDLNDCLKVKDGQHPLLLKRHYSGKIHIETLIVINDQVNFVPYWNKKIEEPMLWPDTSKRLVKLKPFLQYDQAKLKRLLLDHFRV